MKNLQNLKGAKALSKQEQQSINGGAGVCSCSGHPDGTQCLYGCHKLCPGECQSGQCVPW